MIEAKAIAFHAYLAGTNTSTRPITIGNDGDAKVVLEVSSNELASVMRLATMGKQLLRIVITGVE